MSEATRILSVIEGGDSRTAENLLPVVSTERWQSAVRLLARERTGQPLQATAFIHETWLRLMREKDRKWRNPEHFSNAAAEAMRRILIARARSKGRWRHGDHMQQDKEPERNSS